MLNVPIIVQAEGDMLAMIRKELNEVPSRRDQDLQALKDWLKKQPHLPDEFEDICLINFLRGCSFSMEKTKRKLDMYFTMRAACPQYFKDRDINRPELMVLMTRAQNVSLPHLTPNGRRVIISRGLDKKLETRQLVDAYKINFMTGDIRMREETAGVAGNIYIFDADIVVPSHLGSISLVELNQFVTIGHEAYPIKIKEIHVVNASKLIDTLYNVIKPILKEKIKKRIYFHKDFTSLHKHVPKNILPPEYGGTSYPLEEITKAWVAKLNDYKDWFKEQESVVANESLRPGAPKNYDDLFGLDGSFRQLAID